MPAAEDPSGVCDREVRKHMQRIKQQQRQQELAEKRKKANETRAERLKQKQADMCRFHNGEGAWLSSIPEAPTFYPTVEEFADPIGYIRKIQHEAAKWGICKVVPPVTPAVPGGMLLNTAEGKRFTFTTRMQYVRNQDWSEFDDAKFFQAGKRYTVAEYEKYAEDFSRKRFGSAATLPPRLVEAEYWREMASNSNTVVEYGNDVIGSAFADNGEDPLASTGWNLQVLPKDAESVLRLLNGDVPGVTSPMLYIGMLFATFAWHVEDHYLYSINYQHMGAQKIWYGVPANDAAAFERVAAEHVYSDAVAKERREGTGEPDLRKHVEGALLGKTTMFSPRLLRENGVRVCRAVQNVGEFVITFPRSYHGGFGCGFNLGEAVNFAITDWFPFGVDSCKRYSRLERLPILPSEELLVTEALLLQDREARGLRAPDPASDNTVRQCYVELLQMLHKKRAMLHQLGARSAHMPHLASSFPCGRCRDMAYLAAVLRDGGEDPRCLSCALTEGSAADGDGEAGGSGGGGGWDWGLCTVLVREGMPQLEDLARLYERKLAAQASGELRSSLGTGGVGEIDDRPFGTLPLGPGQFSWQALPALGVADAAAADGHDVSFLQDMDYLEELVLGGPSGAGAAGDKAPPRSAERQKQQTPAGPLGILEGGGPRTSAQERALSQIQLDQWLVVLQQAASQRVDVTVVLRSIPAHMLRVIDHVLRTYVVMRQLLSPDDASRTSIPEMLSLAAGAGGIRNAAGAMQPLPLEQSLLPPMHPKEEGGLPEAASLRPTGVSLSPSEPLPMAGQWAVLPAEPVALAAEWEDPWGEALRDVEAADPDPFDDVLPLIVGNGTPPAAVAAMAASNGAFGSAGSRAGPGLATAAAAAATAAAAAAAAAPNEKEPGGVATIANGGPANGGPGNGNGVRKRQSLRSLSDFHQPPPAKRQAPPTRSRPPPPTRQQQPAPSSNAGEEDAAAPSLPPAPTAAAAAPAPAPTAAGEQPQQLQTVVNIAREVQLNDEDSPWACVADEEVDIDPPGMPDGHPRVRRRVYAASPDPASPRFILAADFVKGCGLASSTSASNTMMRLFRKIGERCAQAGHPAPAMPGRAVVQGTAYHGRPMFVVGSSDVTAVSLVLNEQERQWLRSYTLGVFAESYDPVGESDDLMRKMGCLIEGMQQQAQQPQQAAEKSAQQQQQAQLPLPPHEQQQHEQSAREQPAQQAPAQQQAQVLPSQQLRLPPPPQQQLLPPPVQQQPLQAQHSAALPAQKPEQQQQRQDGSSGGSSSGGSASGGGGVVAAGLAQLPVQPHQPLLLHVPTPAHLLHMATPAHLQQPPAFAKQQQQQKVSPPLPAQQPPQAEHERAGGLRLVGEQLLYQGRVFHWKVVMAHLEKVRHKMSPTDYEEAMQIVRAAQGKEEERCRFQQGLAADPTAAASAGNPKACSAPPTPTYEQPQEQQQQATSTGGSARSAPTRLVSSGSGGLGGVSSQGGSPPLPSAPARPGSGSSLPPYLPPESAPPLLVGRPLQPPQHRQQQQQAITSGVPMVSGSHGFEPPSLQPPPLPPPPQQQQQLHGNLPADGPTQQRQQLLQKLERHLATNGAGAPSHPPASCPAAPPPPPFVGRSAPPPQRSQKPPQQQQLQQYMGHADEEVMHDTGMMAQPYGAHQMMQRQQHDYRQPPYQSGDVPDWHGSNGGNGGVAPPPYSAPPPAPPMQRQQQQQHDASDRQGGGYTGATYQQPYGPPPPLAPPTTHLMQWQQQQHHHYQQQQPYMPPVDEQHAMQQQHGMQQEPAFPFHHHHQQQRPPPQHMEDLDQYWQQQQQGRPYRPPPHDARAPPHAPPLLGGQQLQCQQAAAGGSGPWCDSGPGPGGGPAGMGGELQQQRQHPQPHAQPVDWH